AGATVVAGDGYAVNADGTATVSSIAPNTSAIVKATYTVTQADIDAGTVTNAATVTPSDPKVDPEKPDVVVPVAKLTTTKAVTSTGTGEDGTYKAGDVVTYDITVTNTGNTDLAGITVSDEMSDGGTAALSDSAAFDLAAGQTKTITATYTVTQADVDAGTTVTNVATATSKGGTTDPSDPAPFTPEAQNKAYTTAKTVTNKGTGEDGAFKAGETVDFDITVKNTGNTTLTDTLVSDDLAGATVVAGDGYAVNADGTATVSSIAPNTSAIVKATYTVTQADVDAGNLSNVATVTTSNPGTDPQKPTTPIPTTPPTTPVVPGPTTPTNTTTTTTTTVTTNTTVNTVIYPVATVLQNVYQSAVGEEPTPLAAPSTESIDENGTPLATTAEPVCWVHWYIMLGMLVTLVYGLVVLFRRRRYTKGLKNREKHVLREDDDQQDKQGESAPTIPSGAEA
ncbi:MAG: hypothetical protein PHS28_00875, partial [Atopobiaceae bacterium]|nr:hypothetical protein [Atopobiaceae bacterium]